MSYIEESLSKNEEIQERFAHHWTKYVAIWLVGILGILVLIGPLVAFWMWLSLKKTEYGVTNKRVITKTGVISRHSEEMKLTSIETVEIRQSFWGRIFGSGSLLVTGRGTSDLIIPDIDNPLEAKKMIEGIEPV